MAFPTMIFVVHWRGLVRGDRDSLRLAKRWAKVSAVLFAIDAVSGTVLSFEMGLLWPGLMGPFGDVLGLPFALDRPTWPGRSRPRGRHRESDGFDKFARTSIEHTLRGLSGTRTVPAGRLRLAQVT